MNEKIKSIAHSKKMPLTPRRLPRKKSALRQVHQVLPTVLRVKSFPMHFEFSKFYAEFEYFGQFGEVEVEWLHQSLNFPHFSDLSLRFGHPLSASLAYLVGLISPFSFSASSTRRSTSTSRSAFWAASAFRTLPKSAFTTSTRTGTWSTPTSTSEWSFRCCT